jgi:hypothetical protein
MSSESIAGTDAFPRAVAVGLDGSEPMRDIAAERMAAYGELPREAHGPFDVVVSSRAIHHVPSRAKQRLYVAIFESLAAGDALSTEPPAGGRRGPDQTRTGLV